MDDFFQEVCSASELDGGLINFCRKKIFHGMPAVFHGSEEDYFEFRKRIADKFDIGFHEVFIVGSAKLGFSPLKNTEFSFDSDVDVVLLSSALFESFSEKIRAFQMNVRDKAISEYDLKGYHVFLEYMAMGWIRPDMLPTKWGMNMIKRDWFDFFNSISNGKSEIGNYKVSAGLFKSYHALEQYQLSGLQRVVNSVNIKSNL